MSQLCTGSWGRRWNEAGGFLLLTGAGHGHSLNLVVSQSVTTCGANKGEAETMVRLGWGWGGGGLEGEEGRKASHCSQGMALTASAKGSKVLPPLSHRDLNTLIRPHLKLHFTKLNSHVHSLVTLL